MRNSLSLVVVAAILGSAAPAVAQNGTLRGAITAAEDGAPIAGAVVRLPGIGRSAVSDAKGLYAFTAVPPGRHEIFVEALGRAPVRETVMMADGSVRVIDLALPRAALAQREIRVVIDRIVGDRARADRIPGSADVIGPEELRSAGLLFDDIHQVLRRVPGVVVVEEDGYGLRPNIGLRGTGSERSSKITLMEDGVLIAPAPYAAPAAYYFPVAGRMEAIEVRKGSSQIKYGPRTTGGAVNLVSSSIPERLTASADLEAGRDQTGKGHFKTGDRRDHIGWLVETYQIRTDGFKRLDGGGDTGFEIQDYLAKLAFHTAPGAERFHEIELKLGHTDETSNETYLGLTESDFRAAPFRRYAASQRDVMRSNHDQVQARWTYRPAGRFELTTVAYDNRFDRNWYKLDAVLGKGIAAVLANPDENAAALAILRGAASADDALVVRANNRRYYARGFQSAAGLALSGAGEHAVELGVRYHTDREDRFQHDDRYRMDSGRMVLTTAGAPGSQSNRVNDARAWALYVQDEIALGRWTITPGLRWETIGFTLTDYSRTDPERESPTRVVETSVDVLIPGIGVTYSWSEALQVFTGIHRGFGPPGPGAHEDTRPEDSVNVETGARFRRSGLEASVVGFVSDYRNILGRATLAVGDPTGAGELFNGGAVRVSGLELGLDADPATALGRDFRTPIALSYTFTRGSFRTSFQSDFEPWGSVERGDELPYLPEHQLQLSAGLGRGRWEGRVDLTHVSAMRTEAGRGGNPEVLGTDAFTVWNASTEFHVSSWSSVFGGVQNLTDAVHVVARRPAGARPGLPRAVVLGVRVRT